MKTYIRLKQQKIRLKTIESQQKFRLGTISNIKLGGKANRFYRRLTPPSSPAVVHNTQPAALTSQRIIKNKRINHDNHPRQIKKEDSTESVSCPTMEIPGRRITRQNQPYPGGPSNRQEAPVPTNQNEQYHDGAIKESDARPTGAQPKKATHPTTMIRLKTKHADCRIILEPQPTRLQRAMIFLNSKEKSFISISPLNLQTRSPDDKKSGPERPSRKSALSPKLNLEINS